MFSLIAGNNPRYIEIRNLHLFGTGEAIRIEGKDSEVYPDYPPDSLYSGEDGSFYLTFKNVTIENSAGYSHHNF